MQPTNRERLISLLIIGICDALKSGAISIDEAEHMLFSPYTLRRLESFQSILLPIVHAGTELDDLRTILPAEYVEVLSRIKENAMDAFQTLPKYDFQEQRWIDLILGQE